MDPIEHLARDDKWYLGAGDAAIFAPPFPIWLDRPGFWDEATLYHYAVGPLFTVAVLDEDGLELPLRLASRRWTPAELTAEYELGEEVSATEVRTVHPGGVFVSEWRLRATRTLTVHLVAWTVQDAATTDLAAAAWDGGALRLTRSLRDRRGTPLTIGTELACTAGATSWAAYLSARSASQPYWRVTPFVERWHSEGLSRELRLDAAEREGLLYSAVHRAILIGANGASATFAMRLAPQGLPIDATRAPAGGMRAGTLGGASRRRWHDLFERVPTFRCSDPYLETYYWYRWYGLFLHAVAPGVGRYTDGTMCEGIGPLHQASARAAPSHVRELRWLADPALARGVLRTFFANQREDGAVPDRVYVNGVEPGDPRQSNWGDALLAVDASAPDAGFLAQLYPRIARYAEWLVEARDARGSGMMDADPRPASARVPSAAPPGDAGDDTLRLKGVDATTYAYTLFRALERCAPKVALSADAKRWKLLGDRAAVAVRRDMWDGAAEMFSDVDSRTERRTNVRAASCFLPFMTDLATAQHLKSIEHHLADPDQFWTVFPVPTLSLADPRFDATGQWQGRRHAAPLNGRVWPRVNCEIADALGRAAIAFAPHLRPLLAQFLSRFVRMMFHQGDLRRPNAHEHYNPFSGHASTYRGIDDHQDSWVNDLIIQYALGVRPHDTGITIDPFPFQLDYAETTGVHARGVTLDVRIEGERVLVTVDGVVREGRLGTPMEVGR